MEPGAITTGLLAAGVAAPFVYAVTVVVGAAARSDYSHAANAISELITADAPHRAPLNLAFLAYNVLFAAFGFGIARHFSDGPAAVEACAWILVATGVLGVVMVPFPMDPVGSRATPRGIRHLVIAGLMSLGSMAAVLAFAIGIRGVEGWHTFSTYSYASLAAIAVTGALAALAAARRWPLMGLLERLTIGAALQWVAMLAFVLLNET